MDGESFSKTNPPRWTTKQALCHFTERMTKRLLAS